MQMPRRRDPEAILPLKPKPFLLLLSLQEHGALHGYAIKKAMHGSSGGTVAMDPGGLYRLIARLERDGLIRSVPRPTDDADERRQYVAITDWGRAVLAAEARRIAQLARVPAVQALARGPR
jgi:DNA-binding PadR family transcriptional regulator